MRIYSIIITIITILALGATGYFYMQSRNANQKIGMLEQDKAAIEKDLDKTKQELTNAKTSFDDIKPFSATLKAVLNSFIAGGDTKAGTINTTQATLVQQKIGDIADNNDKTSAEKNWNDFQSSNKLRDLQPLLLTLSFGIERNIQNATNHPK